MKLRLSIVLLCIALGACTGPAGSAGSSLATVYDKQVSNVEGEVTSLAEAMPAFKFDFAPKDGEFTKVRTFALQVRHIATTNYMIAAALLKEKNPVDPGTNENGAASLTSKDQIMKYLKDSFAYVHKAVKTITPENELEMIQSAFGPGQTTRAATAMSPVWHTYDHYGQMVVYARMNGVIPPASR